MSNNNPVSVKQARDKLWRLGYLDWKMSMTQKKIHEFINTNPNKITCIVGSRRIGKSYYLFLSACMQCIMFPKSTVKYIQPTVSMIQTNLLTDFADILEDIPEDIRPEFKINKNMYVFPNGSKIQFAGTDNQNFKKLRGGQCHLAIVDEAGFCSDLKQVLNYVLIPTTARTKGKIILSSTLPPEPNHPFYEYVEACEVKKSLIVKTIMDARDDDKDQEVKYITDEIIQGIVDALPGGFESDEFQLEFMCKRVGTSENTVIPEFTPQVAQDTVVEWFRPPFYDSYVAMDVGFTDLTVVLFAYHDFDNQVVVIEDELVMNGPKMTISVLAQEIKRKEQKLWTNKITGEVTAPYLRVSDNNLIVINDLMTDHYLRFLPTAKQDRQTHISKLRQLINEQKLIINPRCTTLINHLKGCKWDKARKDFTRSPDGGHYDAVAALIYLIRNIDFNRNPYPAGYRKSRNGDNMHYNELIDNSKYKDLKRILLPRRNGNRINK